MARDFNVLIKDLIDILRSLRGLRRLKKHVYRDSAVYEKDRKDQLAKLENIITEAAEAGFLNRCDTNDMAILHHIVTLNDPEVVAFFIETIRTRSEYPSIKALNLDATSYITSCVNVCADKGVTPLILAVDNSNPEIVKLLLNAGAYVNWGGKYQDSPAVLAHTLLQADPSNANKQKILDLIKREPAFFEGKKIFDGIETISYQTLKNLDEKGAIPTDAYNYWDLDKETSLLEACFIKDNSGDLSLIRLDLFRFLLEKNPEKNRDEIDLERALAYAITFLREKEDLTAENKQKLFAAIELLLKIGADPDIKLLKKEMTPLLFAIQRSVKDLVDLLISYKSDVNYKDSWNETPLMYAAKKDYYDICKKLLDADADKSIQNRSGDDCLIFALQQGHHESAKVILEYGSAEKMADYGYTELMLDLLDPSISIRSFKGLDVLNKIKDGKYKDLDAKTHGGFTALMIAAEKFVEYDHDVAERKFYLEIIRLLIKSKVDYTKRNKLGYCFLNIMSICNENIYDEFLIKLWDVCGQGFLKNCAMQATTFLNHLSLLAQLDADIKKRFNTEINTLDEFGRTPLSYAQFVTTSIYEPLRTRDAVNIYNVMVRSDAKYKINGKIALVPLHARVLAAAKSDEEFNLVLLEELQINVPDILGRTPLHYACMQGNFKIIKELVKKGGKLDIQDQFGRTPLHYAAMGNSEAYLYIASKFSKTKLELKEDIFGVPAIIYALQYANKSNHVTSILDRAQKLSNNETVQSFLNSDILSKDDNKYIRNLAVMAALSNYCLNDVVKDQCLKQARHRIQAKHSLANDEFPENLCFGIELEVPEPSTTFMPLDFMLQAYEINSVSDATVHPSLFSPLRIKEANPRFELVTPPISSLSRFNQVLEFINALQMAGARVNRTSGLHVHFNVRGSKIYNINRYIKEDQEFTFAKYLALNFINVEQILRGIMRGGALYDDVSSAYTQALAPHLPAIQKCTNIDDLKKICAHNKTLDLTALDKHGTVEFRMHEGAIDPTLIRAWVDCTARLVKISKKQADQHKSGAEITAAPEIEEQLAYTLMAKRMYSHTWDPGMLAVRSADMLPALPYPGKDAGTERKTPQMLIQESPLYNLFNILLGVQEVAPLNKPLAPVRTLEEYLQKDGVKEQITDTVIADLRKMVTFEFDNPGIIPFTARNKFEILDKITQLEQEPRSSRPSSRLRT